MSAHVSNRLYFCSDFGTYDVTALCRDPDQHMHAHGKRCLASKCSKPWMLQEFIRIGLAYEVPPYGGAATPGLRTVTELMFDEGEG